MANWQTSTHQWVTQYSALSQREKLMILLTGLVLIVMVGYSYVLYPMWQKEQAYEKETRQLKMEQRALLNEQIVYLEHLEQDLNAKLSSQQIQLNKTIAGLDKALDESVVNLVHPQTMPAVIQAILEQADGLEITEFSAQQPSPLVVDTKTEQQLNLFRHGVSVKVEGSYRQLYQFLAKVEQLPWQFYWHNFNYVVLEHPKAELSVNIYTLSLKKGFIGL
ncbi:type II secretion system protein M [Catenovulum sp. SM1970]|uniref:type II secretion system protein GspM n=1 Tax=Marinifaba aquimaris TaxID=2741323 RepID=UPI001572A7AF|nr:type II secretion system protein GspM [Marinifaba aquimaris]NTS75857.1 type II secretion system protein M [Marinifaba aquimaris]